jgi:hypothetical protein
MVQYFKIPGSKVNLGQIFKKKKKLGHRNIPARDVGEIQFHKNYQISITD